MGRYRTKPWSKANTPSKWLKRWKQEKDFRDPLAGIAAPELIETINGFVDSLKPKRGLIVRLAEYEGGSHAPQIELDTDRRVTDADREGSIHLCASSVLLYCSALSIEQWVEYANPELFEIIEWFVKQVASPVVIA